MEIIMNRETWLTTAIHALVPLFDAQEISLPPVRVSCGFPGGRGSKASTIGQCWNTAASTDEVSQIFISPVLDDKVQVLATLVHELIHAVDNCESGHKGPFAKMAKAMGLTGKMTATVAGEDLVKDLEALDLPDYPHAALVPGAGGGKKDGTRMIKVICPEDGYTLRTTKKWIDIGLPSCPCGEVMEIA